MQLIPRRNLASEAMLLAEEALQRRFLCRTQGSLLLWERREESNGLAAPGDDDPFSIFRRLHVTGQVLVHFP
jgi:hypothetical protein